MNSRGVMGFPMRLTIAFIIIALCVPALSNMTEGFRDGTDLDLMEEQAGIISDTAARVFLGGAGSSASVEVDLVPGYAMCIGGEGADAYSICILKGDYIVERICLEHPAVRFVGPVLADGDCTIVLTSVSIGGYGVEARIS